ncbi:MAG: hypothetical protein II865_07320 [Bacteroidales bacterium]|nr:hypothetical protein [Bacteroidales bacterium]
MRHIYKILAGFLFVVCSTSLFAQVRTVTFTGRDRTNQYHIPLTQVTVFNLDQLWEEVLYYPDTVLILGSVGVEDYETGQNLQLMQNVPNPFNGTTEFALQLPENRDVLLEIYDITGKLAVGQRFSALSAGTHLFQATLSSPQTYLLSAKVDNGQMTIKMVNNGYGEGNTIRHLGMTDKNGDFTIYLKNDQAYSGYPFRVGDEMKYVGFAMIDEIMMQSGTIIVHQYDNETVPLLFDVTVPTVTTHITSVSVTSANGGGFVTNSGGSPVAMRGVCWSTNPNPTIADNHTDDGSGTGSFSSAMTDLTPNTTYFLRAYATNSVGTGYGEQITFTTPCNPMNVSITGNTAINYGQSATLTASGANSYLWSTNATTASITVNPASTTTYTVTGTNIYSCTATASITVTVNPILPTVTTNDVANITETTAVCGGNVISDGGAPTYRGVCWSTSPNPTVSGSHTMDGTGTGSFTSSITGLTPNTTYYVRAYATNNVVGTSYGEEMSFTTPCNVVYVSITGNTTVNYGQATTLTASGANNYQWSTGATTASITVYPTTTPTTMYTVTGTNSYGCTATASVTVTVNPVAPTVTTNNVSNIQATSATCGGNVTSHGGSAVMARGVCWGTSQNPTVNNSHTTNGSGTGTFTSSLTGLLPNTTYYVRAYATNSVGTMYGEQKSFTTPCNVVSVSIAGITTINYGQSTTLTASGAISYYWSTNATTANITVSPATTTTYTVTGTNAYGCTATASKTVTVNPILPTVTTNDVANITENSASCGGNVTSDGGATVTARGVCWSIFQEPTVSGSHTTNGNGTGSYSSSMTGLNPNTTYYVRAYATNSVGTVYGEVRSFTATNDGRPCLATPTVTDVDGNVYNTVQIGDQCWMRENLRTTKYADGVAIPTGTDTSSINPYYYNYTTSSIPMEQRGLLYNWPAVMHGALSSENNPSCVQGICPDGWHVPSAAEWDQLTSYVGGQIQYSCSNGIGKALASEVEWSYSDYCGECDPGNQSVYVNNVTGFSAFPAGYFSGMSFGGSGNEAAFWSATTVWYEHSRGFGKNLYSTSDRMTNTSYYKSRGNSVRCLRDVSPSIYSMSCPGIPTVTDVEGNTYNTVQIGNQCWMRENLRTTKYADGTLISAGADTSSTTPYYYNYTTSHIPLEQRGLLYNWPAVMHGTASSNTIPSQVQGICPDGWHVPSDAEWTQLTSYVGSRAEYLCDDNSSYIAKALAAKTEWNTNIGPSNTCSVNHMLSTNNATGFSALPCGSYYNGYGGTRETTEFWSATEWNGTVAIGRRFHLLNVQVTNYTNYYRVGCSVRCLCDDYATTNIPPCPTAPTVVDIDGNTYNTVQIGEQCWMRENLRTIHYADGSEIPSGGTNRSTTVPYYYNYTSSSIPLVERGLLYNWPAAMHGAASSNTIPSYVQGICPNGWHVPSAAEWTQLNNYVSSQSEYTCGVDNINIAKALADTAYWSSSTTVCAVGNDLSANNATGLGSLPAGRYYNGSFYGSGIYAALWSATENNSGNPYTQTLYYYYAIVNNDGSDKDNGYSVRCLRDVDVPSVVISSCPGTPSVTDVDGNTYNTVQIGNQCWMRENLRTTHFADGSEIPSGGTNISTTVPYYYDYSASPIPLDERGLLYNWPAAMQGTPSSSSIPSHVQGICPTGWHVPSNAEWSQLKNYVGGQDQYLCGNYSGSIAKALASTTRWSSSINTCAVGNTLNNNNTTGFSAIPAGSIISSRFINSGIYAYFWSTTERDSMNVYFQSLACSSSFVNGVYGQKHDGFSIRCLRDSVHGSTVPVSGSPCSPQAAAQPLCLNENVSYITNSSTNVSASDYFGQSSVGCLGSTPSPSWLYIQIDQPGNLTFRIEQRSPTGFGLDVDFACWGPFSAASQDEFLERLCNHYYSLNVEHHNNNTSDTGYPYGNLVDCSYDQRYSEYCHIPNALSGEWYLLLVTNYSQQPGTITFIRDSSSTTTTNCALTAEPIVSGFADIPPARPLHNNCKANAPDYATLRAYFDANITVALPCSGTVIDTVVFYLGNSNVVADGNPDIFATTVFVTIYAVVTDNTGNTSAKTPVFQLRKPAPMYITHGAISIDTLELCVDAATSMHFNNNSVMNAGEPCTYQWSQIDVVGSSVITSNPNNYLEAVVAPFDQLINTSTHFTMTVTDAYGCVAADTSNAVHFYRLPDVTVSQDPRYAGLPHGDDGAVCPNYGVYMVKATGHSNLPDSIPNYQYLLYEWSGESVNIYSTYDTTGVYILPEQNNRQYEVFAEVTNKKGCSATSSFVVTVRDTTAPVFNGTLPDGRVCKSSDGKYHIPDFTTYFTNQTVSDNCYSFSDLTITQNPAAGTEFYVPTEATITLSDRWGNGRQYAIEVEPIISSYTFIDSTICESGLPISWNGVTFSGPGTQTVALISAEGCDSVVVMNLVVLLNTHIRIDTTVCRSELPFTWNGVTFNDSGTQMDMLVSAEGCDSVVTMHLTVINCTPTGDGQPCTGTPTVTDVDGNIYNTVQIGQQCWMKENLRTTKYADGTNIPAGGDNNSFTLPYYYDYGNSNYGNSNIPLAERGLLYNWPAVMHGANSSEGNPSNVQGVCPVGWHVPSDAEWTQLTDYVSSQSEYLCDDNNTRIAKALAATNRWDSGSTTCSVGYNQTSNNATGFSAIPSGQYNAYGSWFTNSRYGTYFWSATDTSYFEAWIRCLIATDVKVYHSSKDKNNGCSVRCLRDSIVTEVQLLLPIVTSDSATLVNSSSAYSGGNVISGGGGIVTDRGVCWSISQNPTIDNNHYSSGRGGGAFTTIITGLSPSTTYYVRAYATNDAGTAYGEQRSFTTMASENTLCPGTIADIDGNIYTTVRIGGQCWMRENLRTTKYADGTDIIQENSGYDTSSVGWYYRSGDFLNNPYLGLEYNWSAVMHGAASSDATPSGVQGICPDGWHVPSDAEWTQLFQYVGNQSQYLCDNNSNNIAKALASSTGWNYSANTCAVGNMPSNNNSTGFSALPNYNDDSRHYAYFWSATKTSGSEPKIRYLVSDFEGVCSNIILNGYSCPVRCLFNEDQSQYFPSVSTNAVNSVTSTTAVCGGTVTSTGIVSVTDRGVCWSILHNPTIAENHAPNGSGTGSFTGSISGLSTNTTYYLRAYATTIYGTVYGNEVQFTTPVNFSGDEYSCPNAPVLTDADGNIYNTLLLGGQCWMRENLRTTKYANGSSVAQGNMQGIDYSDTTGYWYYPVNDSSNKYTYGLLYNWYAVMNGSSSSTTNPSGVQGICPTGWHVPSPAEWSQLTDYVSSQSQYWCGGDSNNIAKALASTAGWFMNDRYAQECSASNIPGNNNATGFGVLPAGAFFGGEFNNYAYEALYWSSTQYDDDYACYWGFAYMQSRFFGDNISRWNKKYGFSVRCLCDAATAVIDSKSCPAAPTVTDHEGNVYATVQIGDQCWMRENLRTTHYSDGASISLGSDTSTVVAYRYYPNNDSSNVGTYGYLYNWKAVMRNSFSSKSNPSDVQGICPTGWHLPSAKEWMQLTDYLSSTSQYFCGSDNTYIAKALAATEGWCTSTNTCAVGNDLGDNNAAGFGALPAGCFASIYYGAVYGTHFWSCTESGSSIIYTPYLGYNSTCVLNYHEHKCNGYSVRCLRDETRAVIDERSCSAAPTVTDHEDNVYATVQIGNQCWMRDNLRTTTSPSTGTYLIPSSGTGYTYTGKWARWLTDDSTTYAPMYYGLLYNWNAAVDTFNTAYGETSMNTSSINAVSVNFYGHRRGICPVGWHIPSDAEWTSMTTYVGNQSEYTCSGDSSYIAKALASKVWRYHTNSCAIGNDLGSNNATGFGALSAGQFSYSSSGGYDVSACFWSATESGLSGAYNRGLYSNSATVDRGYSIKSNGYSVRCLRDAGIAVVDSKSCPAAPTVTDHEGNVYATVQIGDQCWMRDNLRTTTSPSTGTYLIPAVGTTYTYTGKQARWYNDDSTTYAPMNYGLLYNWNAAVDTFNTAYGETSVNTSSNNAVLVSFTGHRRGICPSGWHLPSDAEWTDLTDYVSSQPQYTCGSETNYNAKALADSTGWNTSTDICAVGNDQSDNNKTGFSAFPAGNYYGSYNFSGKYANFWSSTENNSNNAWLRNLYYYNASVNRNNFNKHYGYSVRCLRD